MLVHVPPQSVSSVQQPITAAVDPHRLRGEPRGLDSAIRPSRLRLSTDTPAHKISGCMKYAAIEA
jgi:hypothetical protein